MKNLDKIQALNAISTLKNSKANQEQKAAAIRMLAAPKESLRDALEKTTADQATKDVYIEELDTMFNRFIGDLSIAKRTPMDDYTVLNTIYTECNAKLKKLPQKEFEGSLPTASSSSTSMSAMSSSSVGFSVEKKPFNMFANQTEESFFNAYNIGVRIGRTKEATPEETRGFYIAINKIKEELDNKISEIVKTESRREISVALQDNWKNLMHDITDQFKRRKSVMVGELSFIEGLVLELGHTFESEYGVDKILKMQATLKKHNTEGFDPAQRSASSTSSTSLAGITEVDESQFPPQPTDSDRIKERHSNIQDNIKLKEKFKEVQKKMKEYKEKQEKKGKGRG